tara:strand:- start:22 stop:261 length:240 start_codon:yes stop_codon:yes gene_type:complete
VLVLVIQGPEVTHLYQVVLRDQELPVMVAVAVIMQVKQVDLPVVKVDRLEIVLTMVEIMMEMVDQEDQMDQRLEEQMVV